ncbi:MAG: cysteine hydrolase [Planctomycetes bacterium]|nr:cysteine hydrolase [Planctomycetota bacterium]
MKKLHYYDPKTQPETLERWRSEVRKLQPAPKVLMDASLSALLVLDVQLYFTNEASRAFAPQSRSLIEPLRILADEFARAGSQVIFTRHVDPEPSSPMRKWWRGHIDPADPLAGIDPAFEDVGGVRIDKTAYSAFRGTNLEEELRRRGIRTVAISGLLTHLCCDTTAREAFMLGYDVVILLDGTASYSEDLHLGSIRALAHGFATPMTVEECRIVVSG